MDGKIRVFLSYSHKDIALVEKLVQIIREAGMRPLWAKTLSYGAGASGSGFDDQIKIFIQHAHVFMPILFENSSKWVHQEIGYAKALNIPVLPITTENINPGGMLSMNNAIPLSDNDFFLKDQLNERVFKKLIDKESPIAIYKRAALVEQRAEMMFEYANGIINMDEYGLVRQKGGLSSFHIPKDIADITTWNNRYFPEKRGLNHIRLQHAERVILEKHADKSGCRLIIRPSYALQNRSAIAARTRIQTLIEFLESKQDDQVVISIQEDQSNFESLTIVGDWFLAESVSFKPGDGFTNTFFTRNAAEILVRIEDFEAELKYSLKERGWTESDSRQKAIEELKMILGSIKD